MSATKRNLIFVLRFVGIFELLAIPTIFLPLAWMNEIHEFLGLGQLPDGPIVLYLARSVSIFYSFHGAITYFISTDVQRYRPIIQSGAMLAICMGVALVVVDITANLPFWWTISEGAFAIGFGAITLWLQKKLPCE